MDTTRRGFLTSTVAATGAAVPHDLAHAARDIHGEHDGGLAGGHADDLHRARQGEWPPQSLVELTLGDRARFDQSSGGRIHC